MRFLLLFLSIAMPLLSISQSFSNLDFETNCDTSATGLCYWAVSWKTKGIGFSAVTYGDSQSLLINSTESGVGFVEQALSLTPTTELQIMKFSASIKTEGLDGKGAGLNIGIYDDDNNMLFNRSMGYGDFNYAKGSSDWSLYTIDATIPQGAASIRLGLISYGKGRALFDEASVEILTLTGRKPSPLAQEYINLAIDTLKTHSLYKDSVDFPALQKTALQIAGPAKTPEETYLAIRYLLMELGDHHSFLMTAKEHQAWETTDDTTSAKISYTQAQKIDDYGYINVPGFHGNDPRLKKAFADSLQSQLRNLYQLGIKGWIVDLRKNDGGNMHPMIAGLGPLFDQDTLGFLITGNSYADPWGYGPHFYKGDEGSFVKPAHPFHPEKALPIAVLMSPATGSSGEIVLISFIGNQKTKTFGEPSYGLTTGNGSFALPDGSQIFLASTRMADRNGNIYYGSVQPDFPIEPVQDTDATLNAALQWLKTFD